MKLYSQKYSAIKMREYRAKDPEKHKAYLRQYRKDNPEKYRLWDSNKALKRRYGISLVQLNQLWENQKGYCACCGQKMKRGGQESLSGCVDHDHTTGKVREILCTGCNIALAHLGENPARCELAAAYLRKHKAQ
jgi:hypothetical protein